MAKVGPAYNCENLTKQGVIRLTKLAGQGLWCMERTSEETIRSHLLREKEGLLYQGEVGEGITDGSGGTFQ